MTRRRKRWTSFLRCDPTLTGCFRARNVKVLAYWWIGLERNDGLAVSDLKAAFIHEEPLRLSYKRYCTAGVTNPMPAGAMPQWCPPILLHTDSAPLRAKGAGGGTEGKGGCNIRGVVLCRWCINTGRISHNRQTLGEQLLSQFYSQLEDCTSIRHEYCGERIRQDIEGPNSNKATNLPKDRTPVIATTRWLKLISIVVLALFACSHAAELDKKGEADKSVDKRGVLGLGYGYGDYGVYGGYGGYGHGLSYAAPIAIAAPVSTVSKVSYGTTHLGGYGYGLGGYGLGYGYASAPLYTAPAVTKVAYAAPALSYASPLDHGLGYSGLGYHGLGYSAPLSKLSEVVLNIQLPSSPETVKVSCI
uniref:Uncharacterized protein n=1 Tax=Timema shepardi TaxID=629360 RepID=A0A7R9G2I8_TIMSH|nr:unnamed protein product [Timema shepardi]